MLKYYDFYKILLKNIKENGDMETLAKFNKRTVRVTLKHNEEAKKLLKVIYILLFF